MAVLYVTLDGIEHNQPIPERFAVYDVGHNTPQENVRPAQFNHPHPKPVFEHFEDLSEELEEDNSNDNEITEVDPDHFPVAEEILDELRLIEEAVRESATESSNPGNSYEKPIKNSKGRYVLRRRRKLIRRIPQATATKTDDVEFEQKSVKLMNV